MTHERSRIDGGGTGIGRAVLLCLAKEGASIAVNFSKVGRRGRQDHCRGKGARRPAQQYEPMSPARSVRWWTGSKGIGSYSLVNNAGMTRFISHANLEAMEEEIWDRTFARKCLLLLQSCGAVDEKAGKWSDHQYCLGGRPHGQGSSIAYCASKVL